MNQYHQTKISVFNQSKSTDKEERTRMLKSANANFPAAIHIRKGVHYKHIPGILFGEKSEYQKKKKSTILRDFRLIGLLLGWFICTTLLAQKPNYKFKTINLSDGLLSSTVQAIFEDSFGFIWLGTLTGVQRFDGKTYKNYEHTIDGSTSLPLNFITGFCEDADNNIWITTRKGLNKYVRKTDKVIKHKWHNKILPEKGVLYLDGINRDISDESILWFSAANIGLIRFNTLNDSIRIYSPNSEYDKLFFKIIPYPGEKDKLLCGSANLFSFDKTTGSFHKLLKLEQNSNIPDNFIYDVDIDPSNKDIIWLSTGDIWGRGSMGGLIRYNLKTGEETLFSKETRPGEVPDIHILQACFYDEDNLWIGTRDHGALLYKTKEDRFYDFTNNEYDKDSFVTDLAVREILIDKSGTMWFGTWGFGISLLSPVVQKFSHYKHLPKSPNGLSDNYITSFAEDKQRNIWIGTQSGGLSKFNPKQKTFENYFSELAIDGQNPTQINYLFYDSHENLWIGTHEDALFRYDPETGIKVHYKKGNTKKDVTQKRISAIAEFKPGEILISTYGGGLNIYDYDTQDFRHYVHDPKDSTSIADNQIWLPFMGNDGKYNFSGNATGKLIQFDPKTKIFTSNLINNTFASYTVPAMTSNGKIYINGVVEGLQELIIQGEKKIKTIYDVNGNSIQNVETILTDSKDKLWLGTGNGLLEFNPGNKILKRYDTDDGLQGNEFNRFAALKSSTGEMYFGGDNGLNVFHPDKINLSTFKPAIIFIDFKLFQKSVIPGENSPLKKNILLIDHLNLDFDQNDFSITFAALDFSNPHNIEYKYILENHDEEWINSGHSNRASYTNMSPGEYSFKVMATNADGIWNEEVKTMHFSIRPPWWQTTLAYVFYGIVLIAGVILVDRFQRKRLREKSRAQAREKELTQAKEIEKAYHELKNTQKQLIQSEKMASLGELTAGIAHEIQNPLNFVNNFSDLSVELLEELDEEMHKENLDAFKDITKDLKQNLEKITQHGKRASSIVKGMLEHSRAGNGLKEPTDINALANEYISLAFHGLKAKNKSFNADFKIDLDESLPAINVVGQDIARVVLNLINNAFQACAERSKKILDNNTIAEADSLYKPIVTISTKNLGDKVEIRVKDNGGGIPSSIIDNIFQPFFTTKPSGQGTGLGLSLSYDIITKGHGGDLKVETREGEGSTFIIQIPAD